MNSLIAYVLVWDVDCSKDVKIYVEKLFDLLISLQIRVFAVSLLWGTAIRPIAMQLIKIPSKIGLQLRNKLSLI